MSTILLLRVTNLIIIHQINPQWEHLATTKDNIKYSISKPKEIQTLPAITNRSTKLLINKKKINQRTVSIFSNNYYIPFKNQMNHKKNKFYDIIHQINGVKFEVKR